MGRFSFIRWSVLILALFLAAACDNGKSDGSSSSSSGDKTPPTIISTTPANGNLNVDINATISVTFSEGMDPASLSSLTFTLSDFAGYRPGAVTYNAATRVASFIPTASLSPDTRYFVTVTTGAKDVAGNPLAQGSTWVFWTNSGSDAMPPSVVANSLSPADGSKNVALTAHVTVTFSESMDPASLDSFAFYLLENNFSLVPANISYNDATKMANLVPSQPLKDDTTYTVWVTNWATDKAGNWLSPEVSWTFQTVDKTPPEVVLVSPASGAGGVAASSAVTVTFSESVDQATLNATTIKLTGPSGDVPGAITYNDATKVATFTPANVLQDDSIYFAIVTTGVKDTNGNALQSQSSWNFITKDTVGPFVAYMFPKANAVSVQVSSAVTATFSEAIDPLTVNTRTVKVEDITNVPPVQVPGQVLYNSQTQVATFNPFSPLTNGTQYRVSVTTDVRDNSGNQLQALTSWTFTTGSLGGGDLLAPSVASTSPAKNASNVVIDPDGNLISVTFSEPIDPSSLTGSIFLEGAATIGLFSYDEASYTATFSAILSVDSRYVIVVTTGVRDQAGNPLDVEVRWPFSTMDAVDDVRPSVTTVSPANGDTQIGLDEIVTANFSEAMDPATITAASFTLTNELGAGVAGAVAYNAILKSATFTPNAALTANTYYMARITMAASDEAGNPLVAQKTWGFTTLDNVPPSVVATTPGSNAASVPVTASVQVLFSEPIDPASVTFASVKLATVAGELVPGVVQYDAATNVASFTPSSDLTSFTAYRVTVTKGVRDVAGNQLAAVSTWDFTTAVGSDSVPPSVFAVSPADGASSVSLTAAVTVTFDEPMDAASISTASFTLLDSSGGDVVGTVTYNATSHTATFRSAVPLLTDSLYVAVVTVAAKDASGNALSGQYSWSFSTIDLSPPIVFAVSPLNGAVQVPVGAEVAATFSEPIDASTLAAGTSFIVVDDAGAKVPGSVNYDTASNTATFVPDNLLSTDTSYLARVTLGVTDTAGNMLAQEKLWGFRTSDATAPTVLFLSPANLATGVGVAIPVEAVFSEAIAPSTINEFTFTLTDVATGVDVAGNIAYDAVSRTAIFLPWLDLDPLTQYRATLTTGVTDSGANPLAADVTWTFTTDVASNINAPSVAGVTPADGAANVALNASITATFSKPMDATTLTIASFVVTDGRGTAKTGSVSYDAGTKVLTFVPTTPLLADTFYVAQVLASVTDMDGVAMTRGEVWSFKTTTAPNVTLPDVTAKTPATGTLGVLEGSPLTVTFNKAMDPATINTSTITLASAAGAVAGRVTYNTATDVATFTPLVALKSNTYYTATVTTGVKDLSGQAMSAAEVWSFTTADSSPTVIAVTPIDKLIGFAVTGKIYVDFSEDMDPLTINNTNIVMTGPAGAVAGTVSYTFDVGLGKYRATFSPNTTLATDSYYVMQVLTGVQDLSGNRLEQAKIWSFTTNALSDTTPPTVMGNIPWNGATHMSVVNKVSATFSEAMDTSSLAVAFTLFDVTNTLTVPGRIDYDNTTHVATFVPDSTLLPNTNYSATVSVQATDVAGNPIGLPVNWSFTTIADAKTTYDFSGFFTGQYISSATKQETVSLVLLQPAGVSIPATVGPPATPAVDVYATFIGNFSTGTSEILGTIEGKVSGDAASITVIYTKSGCTGTFSGSAVGLLSGGSNITMNFIGQACHGPEFVSIGVLQRVP